MDVREVRFGIELSDPYRWMEGSENPEFRQWLLGEAEQATAYFARIPGRNALRARIRELGNGTDAIREVQLIGDRLFYLKTEPGEQVAKLYVREAGEERMLVDPAAESAAGHHATIDSYAASFDGSKVAYNVSRSGSEYAITRVLDVARRQHLEDRIENTFGETAVAWTSDDTFVYVQRAAPQPGVDPMIDPRTRLHRLGTPIALDRTQLASGEGSIHMSHTEGAWPSSFHGAAWMVVVISDTGTAARVAIAPVAELASGRGSASSWRLVAEPADGIEAATVHGDRIYLLSHGGSSNRRILSVPGAHPSVASARVEIAEDPHAVIQQMAAARDALYYVAMVDGRARLFRWPWRGAPVSIALPFEGWIDLVTTDSTQDGVVFSEQGWLRPMSYYRYAPGKPVAEIAGMTTRTNVDYNGFVAEEVEATSADGTRVPLTILRRGDVARDSSRPTILYGYAGYAVSIAPSFSPMRFAWLEQGYVYALCHARGGGEKGEAWHVEGMREHKMNGVHDMEACAQALFDARLSDPAHLYLQGGSMGGVLLGRAITDRPGMFAAANIQVGIVNPLRLEAAINGATQFTEIGDPATEPGFRAVYEMDPYQHVVSAAYPATLFTVGLQDPRVATWHSGKMAARMQASSTSGKPILIRVEPEAGHGFGSTRNQQLDERADAWSFFLAASHEPGFAPP